MRTPTLLLLSLSLAACGGSMFESIEIADGTQNAAASHTINGGIRVGNDVTVTSGTFRTVNGAATVGDRSVVPDISTVNGAIRIGEDSRAGSLATVNGAVVLRSRAAVDGDIETVNGGVTLDEGAGVSGSIRAVNGGIRLDSAHVGGDVENHNGGIRVQGASVIEGGLTVRRSRGINVDAGDIPEVRIDADARIAGTLRFERPVRLVIHRGAEVGAIEGATPEWVEPEEAAAEEPAEPEEG